MSADAARRGPHYAGDEYALRRTRFRLAAWSGAITLVVLLLLGSTLYLVVARQLAADSEGQLRARAEAMASGLPVPSLGTAPEEGFIAVADSAAMPGLVLGGPLSGTLAGVLDPVAIRDVTVQDVETLDGTLQPGVVTAPSGMADIIDLTAIDAAVDPTAEHLTTSELDGAPVRVLTTPVVTDQGTLLVRVLSDRSAEVATLRSLLLILVIGVPLVAIAAGLAGWVYSGRALVPIRLAIERQRRFAADASHELRTPLTILSGNLQAMARSEGPIAPDDEAITDATAEAERMAELLDALLMLARSDAEALPIELAPMDLSDETTDAVASLAAQAGARGVELVLEAEPTPMHGDAERLRQLLVILVDNATRYAPQGGHVWVTVRPAKDGATLIVADDGPGVAPADRELVFERFWRGPDAHPGGNGLGLSIARWIVGAHGGQIELDARPTGGARFTVRLPIRS
ncbi:MAG: HAMP domain-containing sensor histidine kinase [Candidatus Limnocylindrales bacterium]